MLQAPTTRRVPAPDFEAARRWQTFLRHWGAVVVLSTVALCLLALLGRDVFDHAPGTLDGSVRAWTLAHRTPGGWTFMRWVSSVGAPVCVFAFAAIIALWLARRAARQVAAVVVAAPTIAVAFFNVVKQLVHRARPVGAALVLHEITFSFPSGHATASAAVFPTVAWVLARERLIPWALAIPLALVPPLLIGVSRVYLDAHWATDVLGGWCAGAAVAALSAGVYEDGRRRRADAAARRT